MTTPAAGRPRARTVRGAAVVAAALGPLFLALLLSEVTVYKAGVVLIFVVAAMGMHVLVNWAGELSLAHATFVGLPAFVVVAMSSKLVVPTLALVPVGVLVGALVGGVVGLPALRAKGIQVALVTLAAGVAIDQYFFSQIWLIGPASGTEVPKPMLGSRVLDSSQEVFPFLWAFFVVAAVFLWLLFRSKFARALYWVRDDQAAALANGVPVARYRMFAYVIAGSFAGLAGAMMAIWVQALTPASFPPADSFTYLVVVTLAGRGYLGGLALAGIGIAGVPLFLSSSGPFLAYFGPLSLIATLVMYRDGLNGFGRGLARQLRERRTRPDSGADRSPPDPAPDELEQGSRELALEGDLP